MSSLRKIFVSALSDVRLFLPRRLNCRLTSMQYLNVPDYIM
jgi:hypothetical protein